LLRLTIRSGRDGRFLARVIDRDVGAFVLDYGDTAVVAEVSERALRGGFQAWVAGRFQTAAPRDPHMILLLAHRYAEEGYLVFLDQPDATHRHDTVEELLPDWIDPSLLHLGDLTSSELTLETTEDTDLLTAESARARLESPPEEPPGPARLGPSTTPSLDELLPVPLDLPDLEEDDLPTEQVLDRDGPTPGDEPTW
jgi:hypothetical protein